MNFWTDSRWYAIQAKPRRENFAASRVSALGVETLLPRIKIERFVRGVALMTTKALFPGYFFARFCPQNALESVKCSRGVFRVISSGRFPIPVDDDVIGEIRNRIEEDGLIRIRPHGLKPADWVSIKSGPLEGMIGRVERELDDRRRVAILLDTLSHARVLIERRWLEAEAA
jgi:transcriptional antiterminator RfaH